jgi:uncharacterized protein
MNTVPIVAVAECGATEAGDNLGPMQRRCLVRGTAVDRDGLLRFVVGPENILVPDVDQRLPGRGLWLTADREIVEVAIRRKVFAKAARQAVQVPDDLMQQLEVSLVRRCRDLVGLARRAGQALFGYQKVRERLLTGAEGVLLEAIDGSEGECRKLRALAPTMTVVRVLSAAEIGAGIGREYIVHGLIDSGRLADRLVRDARRLTGLRPAPLCPSPPAQST